MDRERWKRIEEILDQALELPVDEVAAFLDVTCAGEPEIRSEVESLLDADRRADGFLEGAAADLVPIDVKEWHGNLEGVTLGPWRVIHEIGRGGMSSVHLAERADGQYDARVAIKVLRREIATREPAIRFHRERQILASLDHPAIVRIHDGGVTPDGRPFLVMDYIDGERIDRYCDRHRLPVEDRLRLFLEALDAVQYAHRNLIVHRDLKPANILITTDGRVRLLDFGIAKLLDATGGPDFETRTGARPMTPEYASPEQVRGDHITTGSDVYALGVLLYELLTGHRPFVLAESTPWAIEHAICESDPERPSDAVLRVTGGDVSGRAPTTTPETISDARRTVPAVLRSTLNGDLDAIVMKALRKEPESRYASANAFADDIERYLGGHPVHARQGNRLYALRKFTRRNRWPVAATSLIVMLLATSTILISIEQSKTERQRILAEEAALAAERESETADQVTDFLVQLFASSDPFETLGDSISARVLLERGRERIDRELQDQPAVRASLLLAIGNVYSNLGRYDAADSMLHDATRLRTELYGEMNEHVAEGFEAIAGNLADQRNFYDAHGAFQDALRIRQSLAGDQRVAIARNLSGLAMTHRDTGQPDTALFLQLAALDTLRAAGDTVGLRYLNAQTLLATIFRALGRFAEAESTYKAVLPRQRELLGDRDPNLAINLNNLGFLLRQREDYDGSAAAYKEALDIHVTVFGEDHPRTQTLMQNLAGALIMGGRGDEGIAVLQRRLAAARNRWPDDDWRVGAAAAGLGRALVTLERYAEAQSYFQEGETIYTATIGENHTWTIAVRSWMAGCAALLGRRAEADRLFNTNLAQLRRATLDPDTRSSVTQLARALESHGQADRAQTLRQIVQPANSGPS